MLVLYSAIGFRIVGIGLKPRRMRCLLPRTGGDIGYKVCIVEVYNLRIYEMGAQPNNVGGLTVKFAA